MKVVRDPIHGYIELDELALAIIDTPQMQRLRRIRQLGLSHLVYPGANHTRFEHSLGTYHLTCQLLKHIDHDTPDEVRLAALLHDVGHGPFSHVTEDLLRQYTRRGHDEISHILRQPELAVILDEFSIKPSSITGHIRGETQIGSVLNSEIDMDRMDYLVRDAHYTGVAYGVIDLERLIHSLKLYEGKFVIEPGGLQACESLLVSRFFMHPTVYYHHVSRIAGACSTVGIGPMGAVAGTIAWMAVEAMVEAGATYAFVDNGGDIALFTDRTLLIGIFAGNSPIKDLGLEVQPGDTIQGICTSSGTVGPSISFGTADAALVVSGNVSLADAAATALGNAVPDEGELEEAFDVVRGVQAIQGAIVIRNDGFAAWGELPRLARARMKPDFITRG